MHLKQPHNKTNAQVSEICDKLCGLILEGKWTDPVLSSYLYVSVDNIYRQQNQTTQILPHTYITPLAQSTLYAYATTAHPPN